ncbi:S-type pyocin domain-containing protein [Photorhabdus bodei]|uniref:Killer protein of pyocin s3 n=1 Tax=Photorhabdus bodei TaxID=2029681 RepID=A0A329X876_9GAMM|nr:S-type pyocin domain-containing protein [Photorhabdus bodei]NDK98322.1 killer protein of pyocin s3 [Photorhabdus bodei]NDL02573.1 killer protein of pyocin s3 [Photorhabdus bodei]NDL06647.1 killer protein of pyocin s3 [Photorhabdus bodei]RAX12984.1 killer protein of pyocin s3 [Photorhabdus bodei]
MAIGYYLLVGDKTTCGGQIITGDHTMTFNGRATAREGDKVTCGKHPGTYVIVGGISDMFDMGQRLAGTLDSVSTCPCRARFINSVMDSYEKQEQPRQQAVTPAYTATQNFSSPMKEATTVQSNPPPVTQVPPPPIPVFAKSRQRGKGCTDAGTEAEPANNFGRMGIYQVLSSPTPVTESKPEQPPQGKKHPPEPDKPQDKKLPWYKRWFSDSKGKAEAAATVVAATTRSAVADGETLVMRYIGGGTSSAGRWLAVPNPLTVGLMGLFYSSGLNEGEEDYLNEYHLSEIASQYGKAPTRVRFRWIRDEESGRMTVQGYHVSPESGLDKVPVHMMKLNPATGNYEFWEPGEHRPTILWTPNEQEFKVPPHTGNEEQPFIPSQITVLPIPDKVGSNIESLPMPEEKDFRDYILVFPAGSGMKPVYVMFNTPRNQPGVVTGQGQRVEGNWLNLAGQDMGAPIPSQIADKLRGRRFNNFDDFRRAFWKEVGNDPELSQQFNSHNKEFLKKSYSPYSPRQEHIGNREKYEIHHVKFIKDGGEVYNLDNLRVTTPKRHIEIHSSKGGIK